MEIRDKVLNEIIEFAKENDNIRALVLQGSLINDNAIVDDFSDIDPLFYVKDQREMAFNTDWINRFGNVITNLFDELEEHEGYKHYMRMVIYESGLKVDFGIASVDLSKNIRELPLYKIVLDKDNALPKPLVTDDSNFYVKRPSKEEYLSKINDVFWDSTYIVKSLWRNEIYFAQYMQANLHKLMRPIIEWYIGIKYDFKVNTGHNGRYFRQFLNDYEWSLILDTYSNSDIESTFKAVYASFNLINYMGVKIGESLDYPYPLNHENRVLKYIVKVEKMTKEKYKR
jgi:aminoglycoside 6-adenylyltransferase